MTRTPVIEGWFADPGSQGDGPRLVGSRCATCATIYFPREERFCRNPACDGEEFESLELSGTGTVWSYTDAQYQPPAPYIPAGEPYQPFAIAAVELPEGIVVLGQLADGCTVGDVRVGSTVDLVVETLYTDESGERTVWRWKPRAGEAR